MPLPFDTAFLIDLAGIAVMGLGLLQLIRLRRKIPGGMVGQSWKALTVLVTLFTAAYLGVPFLGSLPADSIRMIIAVIFLFGAVYVVATVVLLDRILEALA